MRINIVSVPGRLVRAPETRRVVGDQPLLVDPTDVYWARLLADGDVASVPGEADPAHPSSPAEPAPADESAPAPAQTDPQPAPVEQPAASTETADTGPGADQAATPVTDQPATPAADAAPASEEPQA